MVKGRERKSVGYSAACIIDVSGLHALHCVCARVCVRYPLPWKIHVHSIVLYVGDFSDFRTVTIWGSKQTAVRMAGLST